MNIFALHEDPKKAARMLCDQHVVKMILESAQMMCMAYHDSDLTPPYKTKGFRNHPCSIWARTTMGNYKWLYDHAKEMCRIYTEATGKIHKSEAVLDWCFENSYYLINTEQTPTMTQFALAMPDEFKNYKDTIQSYRDYYKSKDFSMRYTYNKNPVWRLS